MKIVRSALFLVGVVLVGCSKGGDRPAGPVVEAFTGRVVADGKPVKFPADDQVEVMLFSQKGEQMRIPVTADGAFKLGWMPVGKHSATLTRIKSAEGKKGGQATHTIPGGLEIKEGQTEYTIELGKNFKL